jgi:hypothetical protein
LRKQAVAASVALTEAELDSLNQDGFLKVPRLTSREEALKLRASLERLFAKRAGEKEGAYGELSANPNEKEEPNSPQILLPVNYAPELHKSECFTNALAIAKQILGERTAFVLDLAIYKRALSGEATRWHQDLAFRDPNFDYKEVTIWVALQDVDESTGCLMFVPKSHAGDVLEHTKTNQDGDSIALECVGDFDPAAAVAGAIPMGGCTIHFPGTLHASTSNSSSVPRIAYILTFGVPPRLARKNASFPWREDGSTEMQARRRRWMRRGGAFITIWRRVRRGDLRDWRSVVYLGVRAVKTITRGK